MVAPGYVLLSQQFALNVDDVASAFGSILLGLGCFMYEVSHRQESLQSLRLFRLAQNALAAKFGQRIVYLASVFLVCQGGVERTHDLLIKSRCSFHASGAHLAPAFHQFARPVYFKALGCRPCKGGFTFEYISRVDGLLMDVNFHQSRRIDTRTNLLVRPLVSCHSYADRVDFCVQCPRTGQSQCHLAFFNLVRHYSVSVVYVGEQEII